nr:restriction endonuclease subunit S [uncultured Flavobacterium sp.]
MKKYDNYKDSGFEWIGKIPSHWNISKAKFEVDIINGFAFKSEDFQEKGVPVIRIGDLKPPFVDLSNAKCIDTTKYKDLKGYAIQKGDLLLAMTGATIGKTATYNDSMISYLNQRVGLIKPFKENNREFIKYIFESNFFKEFVFLECSGSAQENIGKSQLGELLMATPSNNEQTAIANYLDHKTTQIDTLISKKQQFITLLQEERITVINQAVTKGLDPKVKMKDSGIEWLGEIPEHWTSYRIDWVTNIVRGNTGFKKDELLENGEYVALQYGKTYKVDIVDDSFNFFVNSEFFKESQVVSKGDTILISTSETVEDLGHTCYYNNGNIGLLGGEQILLKPNRKVLYEKYLYQYARQFGLELKKYAKGLKVFRFNTTDLKQIFIAIPSIEEQIQIADFLDCETIRIVSLINKMENEIELLKEYKTALISEVVTGKVDVREEVLN